MRRFRSTLFIIALNNVLMVLGFRLWQSLFQNFAIEELGVRPGLMGVIQSLREVPGLLGFSLVALALVLTEMRIAGLSVVLMGVGVFLTGFTQDLPGLLVATVVMSIGFHFFYSSNTKNVCSRFMCALSTNVGVFYNQTLFGIHTGIQHTL